MDVIGFLKSKNRCLNRYLALTLEFRAKAEAGRFEDLAEFESRRDSILRTLDLFDRKISEAVARLPASERKPLAQPVASAVSESDSIIRNILASDDTIVRELEKEKGRLLGEAARSQKNKAMLGKFKSGWLAESGEGLDKKL